MQNKIPVLGFVAVTSNAGKTTLITKLINEFTIRNIRVSVVKHAHHQFDIDHPGKDSYKMREAGAVQTLIASDQRWALMTEMHRTHEAASEAKLDDLLLQLNPSYADIIFIEGFKHALMPKIEVFNSALHASLLAKVDKNIIAVVSDIKASNTIADTLLPHFHRNKTIEIADFIQSYFKLV